MEESVGESWGRPQRIERSGSTIHYWIAGPADGPLVVLTHGASMDHRMFETQLEPLVSAGYRVLAWDVRGHGQSKPIGSNFSVAGVANDLRAIIRERAVQSVNLVGHSFGGYVSQEFRLKYPELVETLCLIGASDITEPPPRFEATFLGISPYLIRMWPDSRRRKIVSKYTSRKSDVREYAYNATSQLSKKEFVTVWKAVASAFRAGPPQKIDCPFLLTHGEDDIVGHIAQEAPTWARTQPTCRYEVIPGAAHNANQDNPEYFNEILLDFLHEHVTVP